VAYLSGANARQGRRAGAERLAVESVMAEEGRSFLGVLLSLCSWSFCRERAGERSGLGLASRLTGREDGSG
jgi:hypothetical protein